MKLNIKIFIVLSFTTVLSKGYSQDSIIQYEALRFKDELGFQKPYRILKTTFKSLEGFQTYYPGTKITLEKILRYHLYTAIHINQKENKLLSMDLTEFQLKNFTSEEELTKETCIKSFDLIVERVFQHPYMKELQ